MFTIVLYSCLHDIVEESDQPYKFLRIFSFPHDLPQAVKIDFIKFLGETEEYQKGLLVLISTFLWMLADGKHHVPYALTCSKAALWIRDNDQ